jgi:hypothetical protein
MDRTNLRGANVSKAVIWDVNLATVQNFDHKIKTMFGDASVNLPNGITPDHANWPQHWPKGKLDYTKVQSEWRKWRDNPASYTPPDP